METTCENVRLAKSDGLKAILYGKLIAGRKRSFLP